MQRQKKIRDWRTRPDPFLEDWLDIEGFLKNSPRLQAKTLLQWLIKQNPEKYNLKHLRSLQRRFKKWKALQGSEKSIMFPQIIHPGKQSQSDFTCMNSLNVTIKGQHFKHLLFHFMLPYACWEAISICFSESLESLITGYEEAVWKLGAVVVEHRTDNLTAATHAFGSSRIFNDHWMQFLKHYGVEPSRNNPGEGHENGSVEKSHDLYKTAVDQQLMLRGDREFHSTEAYQLFLDQITDSRNHGRVSKLAEEYPLLKPLPNRKWNAPNIISVRVSPNSTVTVLKRIYSVPSRLINLLLEAYVYYREIVLYYGHEEVQRMPRLLQEGGHNINYRHVIGHLLRKPAAFAHYQYHESLFPRPIYRKAYDLLLKSNIGRGAKQYLEVLNLAAITNEGEVTLAIEHLLGAQELPTLNAVKGLMTQFKAKPPELNVIQPNLAQYDQLIKKQETINVIPQ